MLHQHNSATANYIAGVECTRMYVHEVDAVNKQTLWQTCVICVCLSVQEGFAAHENKWLMVLAYPPPPPPSLLW